ncbi:MAG: ribonuclease protein component [Actinomycetota bacterium]|jgi:ribonuclease P protein component
MLTDSSLPGAHVGYAIGRNVGGAVLRNRIRRQLRSLLEAKSDRMPAGWYLVGVQPRVGAMSWTELGATVDQLLAKVVSS